MQAPQFIVKEIHFFEREVNLRLPFRFGVITLNHCPQVFVSLHLQFTNGTRVQGCAAEMMVPKWFDKNMNLSNEDNFDQLRMSLKIARDAYLSDSKPMRAWQYFSNNYWQILNNSMQFELNHLTANYGMALIDRAIIDSICHYLQLNFFDVVRSNQLGIENSKMIGVHDLIGFDYDKYFESLKFQSKISSRHTIGLLDIINKSNENDQLPVDNLPVTLMDVVKKYGHRYFKIKLSGDMGSDIERLSEISPVIENIALGVTLDGNEQYKDADSFLNFINALKNFDKLSKLYNKIIFIEQPIHRDFALKTKVNEISKLKPMLIDESDSDLDSFLNAVEIGYTGISSKSCKGIYKSLINSARCQSLNQSTDINHPIYFQSGEDLTMQPGIGVQQDLALVSLLGLGHVERNGHHYVNGMFGANALEKKMFLNSYPNLYIQDEGNIHLNIQDGLIDLRDINCNGFASNVQGACIDWNSFSTNY